MGRGRAAAEPHICPPDAKRQKWPAGLVGLPTSRLASGLPGVAGRLTAPASRSWGEAAYSRISISMSSPPHVAVRPAISSHFQLASAQLARSVRFTFSPHACVVRAHRKSIIARILLVRHRLHLDPPNPFAPATLGASTESARSGMLSSALPGPVQDPLLLASVTCRFSRAAKAWFPTAMRSSEHASL
jgi:hypothetical protein